jgi:hypothetical protein
VSTLAGSICLVNSRQRPHGGYTYSKPSPSCQTATVLAIWYSPDSVSPWRRWRCAQHKPVPEPVSTQTPEKRLPAAVYEYRRHVSEEAITDRMRVEHPLRRVDEHRFDVLSTTVNLLRSRASLCNHGGARREDPPLTTQMTTFLLAVQGSEPSRSRGRYAPQPARRHESTIRRGVRTATLGRRTPRRAFARGTTTA